MFKTQSNTEHSKLVPCSFKHCFMFKTQSNTELSTMVPCLLLVGGGCQVLEEVSEVGGVGGSHILVGHVVAVAAQSGRAVVAGDGVEISPAVGAVVTHFQVAAVGHGGRVEVVGVDTGDNLGCT